MVVNITDVKLTDRQKAFKAIDKLASQPAVQPASNDTIPAYEYAMRLTWQARIEANSQHNDVGHDFLCRVQYRLTERMEALIAE